MNLETARKVARAVLYEGYLLYPYHPNSTKNRQRWTFGGVYPRHYVERNEGSDACEMGTECLFRATADSRISVTLGFLQLISRSARNPQHGFDDWEEACEREIRSEGIPLHALLGSHPKVVSFRFPATTDLASPDGAQRAQKSVEGRMEISVSEVAPSVYRLSVRIANTSVEDPKTRSDALLHSLVSAHLLLALSEGEFFSLLDPPEPYREHSEACRRQGLWPVLVGLPGATDLMLASPIILYDYPQIAPESPGDLFDGAEIDEILSLRILTLTDDEKAQIRAADRLGRALLERTESLSGDDLLRLHGILRELKPTAVRVGSTELKAGSRVRLQPGKGADIFDLALQGMSATVQSIEQDLEGRIQIAVTIDEDPGRDLGHTGQPGHRFFFRPDEVEPL